MRPRKTTRPARGSSIETRIAYYTEKANRCWNWRGYLNERGYALLRVGGKNERVHRLVWELENGHIPAGFHVLHRCDNPTCVNPAHLFCGTHADNMTDKAKKGRAGIALDAPSALAIRDDRRPLKDVAADYGISIAQVSRIRNVKSWASVGLAL